MPIESPVFTENSGENGELLSKILNTARKRAAYSRWFLKNRISDFDQSEFKEKLGAIGIKLTNIEDDKALVRSIYNLQRKLGFAPEICSGQYGYTLHRLFEKRFEQLRGAAKRQQIRNEMAKESLLGIRESFRKLVKLITVDKKFYKYFPKELLRFDGFHMQFDWVRCEVNIRLDIQKGKHLDFVISQSSPTSMLLRYKSSKGEVSVNISHLDEISRKIDNLLKSAKSPTLTFGEQVALKSRELSKKINAEVKLIHDGRKITGFKIKNFKYDFNKGIPIEDMSQLTSQIRVLDRALKLIHSRPEFKDKTEVALQLNGIRGVSTSVNGQEYVITEKNFFKVVYKYGRDSEINGTKLLVDVDSGEKIKEKKYDGSTFSLTSFIKKNGTSLEKIYEDDVLKAKVFFSGKKVQKELKYDSSGLLRSVRDYVNCFEDHYQGGKPVYRIKYSQHRPYKKIGVLMSDDKGKYFGTFEEQKKLNKKLSPDQYLDFLAKKLNTPQKIATFLNKFMKYTHDTPNLVKPLLEGTTETSQDYWQTAVETVKRVKNGRMLGDCDDYAFLAQAILLRQGKQAFVVSIPEHAFCVWIEKLDGRYHANTLGTSGLDVNGNHYSRDYDKSRNIGYLTIKEALASVMEKYRIKQKGVPKLYNKKTREFVTVISIPKIGKNLTRIVPIDYLVNSEIRNSVNQIYELAEAGNLKLASQLLSNLANKYPRKKYLKFQLVQICRSVSSKLEEDNKDEKARKLLLSTLKMEIPSAKIYKDILSNLERLLPSSSSILKKAYEKACEKFPLDAPLFSGYLGQLSYSHGFAYFKKMISKYPHSEFLYLIFANHCFYLKKNKRGEITLKEGMKAIQDSVNIRQKLAVYYLNSNNLLHLSVFMADSVAKFGSELLLKFNNDDLARIGLILTKNKSQATAEKLWSHFFARKTVQSTIKLWKTELAAYKSIKNE